MAQRDVVPTQTTAYFRTPHHRLHKNNCQRGELTRRAQTSRVRPTRVLGEMLLDGEGAELPRAAKLKGKQAALYFSAHWCPPCQRCTPELAETDKTIKAVLDNFELVFVSGDRVCVYKVYTLLFVPGDRDAAQFREYTLPPCRGSRCRLTRSDTRRSPRTLRSRASQRWCS